MEKLASDLQKLLQEQLSCLDLHRAFFSMEISCLPMQNFLLSSSEFFFCFLKITEVYIIKLMEVCFPLDFICSFTIEIQLIAKVGGVELHSITVS